MFLAINQEKEKKQRDETQALVSYEKQLSQLITLSEILNTTSSQIFLLLSWKSKDKQLANMGSLEIIDQFLLPL